MNLPISRTLRALAIASAMASGSAFATIGAPDSIDSSGGMTNLSYGATGNVYGFDPYLSILGLGSPNHPTSVTTLNPALGFSYALSGTGTGLATMTLQVQNHSATTTFNDLRLWVIVNPDGNSDYMDQIGEHWPAIGVSGDPAARQSQDYPFAVFDLISNQATLANGLTNSAPPAACQDSNSQCDAILALQWNAAQLAPGQAWSIKVGLSDDGRALGSRFLTAQSVEDSVTRLTFSGLSSIAAIPEPSSGALLATGIAGLGGIVARRRRRAEAPT